MLPRETLRQQIRVIILLDKYILLLAIAYLHCDGEQLLNVQAATGQGVVALVVGSLDGVSKTIGNELLLRKLVMDGQVVEGLSEHGGGAGLALGIDEHHVYVGEGFVVSVRVLSESSELALR